MPDPPLEGFDEPPLPFPSEEEPPSPPGPTRPGRAPAGQLPSPLPPEPPPPSPRLPIPPITGQQLPPFQDQRLPRIPVQPHCPCIQPSPCQQAGTHPYTAPYTKVLFIVDKSRWQNDKYDSGAEIRMNYVHQYYEERRQSGWSWGIIAFSDKYEGLYPFKGSIVWPLILSHRDKDHPAFTDDYQRIHRAINNIGLMEDVGKDVGTGYSYQEPLALAKRTIERDIERSSSDANYHVIFMASAVPKGDHHNDGVEGGLEWRIFEKIDDILELSPNRVSLSTVYYGENRDPATRHTRGEDGSLNPSAYGTRTVEPYNARTVLQAMAERGHGFYDEVLTSSRPAASYTQPPCNCGPSLEPYHPVEDFSQPDYDGLPPCVQQ